MDSILLTICMIVGAMPLTAAFSCYQCTHVKTDSTLSIFYGLTEDQACHDGDTKNIKTLTCASGSSCFKLTAQVSGSVSGSSYSAELTSRICLNVDGAGEECAKVDGASALTSISALAGVTSVSGTACICSSDNCNGQSMPAPAVFTFVISLVMVIFVSM